jgi:hypothetical protein
MFENGPRGTGSKRENQEYQIECGPGSEQGEGSFEIAVKEEIVIT